jgi:hypothetical protein
MAQSFFMLEKVEDKKTKGGGSLGILFTASEGMG